MIASETEETQGRRSRCSGGKSGKCTKIFKSCQINHLFSVNATILEKNIVKSWHILFIVGPTELHFVQSHAVHKLFGISTICIYFLMKKTALRFKISSNLNRQSTKITALPCAQKSKWSKLFCQHTPGIPKPPEEKHHFTVDEQFYETSSKGSENEPFGKGQIFLETSSSASRFNFLGL